MSTLIASGIFCLELEIITTLDNSILTSLQRVQHGSESLSYLGLKIWKSIPTESKQKSFKEFIKL